MDAFDPQRGSSPATGARTGPPFIGFFGWKGGAGRSLLAANMAVALASADRAAVQQAGAVPSRVLLVDLDVEAPGLGDYLERYVTREGALEHPFATEGGWRKRRGFIDILDDAAAGRTSVADSISELVESPALVGEPGRAAAAATETPGSRATPQVQAQRTGRLQFLGPKSQPFGIESVSLILDAYWPRLFSQRGGQYVREFKEFLADHYDCVLIDLRTGLSQLTYEVFSRLLDRLVIVTPPTHQAARGIATAADVFSMPKAIPTYMVISELHRTETTADRPPVGFAGSAEALLALSLARITESLPHRDDNFNSWDRLFRLPRLAVQEGSETLLYRLPASSPPEPSMAEYCAVANRLTRQLLGCEPFDLTLPAKEGFANVSSEPPSNRPYPEIVRSIIDQSEEAKEVYLKRNGREDASNSVAQTGQLKTDPVDEFVYKTVGKPYRDTTNGQRPFGARQVLTSRLVYPFLLENYYAGDSTAKRALDSLDLDILPREFVEPLSRATDQFIKGARNYFSRRSESTEAGSGAFESSSVGDSTNTGRVLQESGSTGPEQNGTADNINEELAKAAGGSRHPWRALSDLSNALEGMTVPPPYDLRVREVRISLLSNAENHLGALGELLALPKTAKDRAVLKALERDGAYASQLNRAIQSAFSAWLDAIAVSGEPKGQEDQLGTISAGLDRLEKLNQGITFQQIIGRYRGALAALNDPAKLGAEDGLANSAGSAPAKGQQSEFDGFFHESVGKVPPSTLRKIPVDLARLDPPEQAFVHSACGRPTEAYGARLRAARAAHRPNEPITGNPRQVTALRDVGVIAARGGAVEPALTQFTDLLEEIPDLYAEGATRNDSWIEEDIQHERRLLLLYRAHCHWMAGDLENADTYLAEARDAHRRYTEAHSNDPLWAIRPLPAFHVLLEARIAFARDQCSTAVEKSELLIPIYRAQVPIDGVPAIERLAGLHRLRARAYRALKNDHEASKELPASLNAANLAPPGNPGPDADRAEAELLQLCWGEAPDAGALVAAFNKARNAIDKMIEFELPDGLLEGPHQSSFQARAVTLAIDCLKANAACALQGEADKLIKGMETVALLKPLCERLRNQLAACKPTSETTTA